MLDKQPYFMFLNRVFPSVARPVFLILLIILLTFSANAQQYVFATLNGSPTIDTSGWNLEGDATADDTPGDANNNPDELLLCPAVNQTSGACFYNQTLDLSVCKKWTAEFDYRIYGGSGADGIAFCFLTNPPTGYALGGGIGIPSNPQGLMVILDQYDNGCGPNPQLQLFYGDGTTDYKECKADVRVTNVGIVRDANYNRCRITYDNGQIEVFINGTLYMSGNYTTNYTGYLGFTSSTGGSTDNHSIKNAVIYTSKPPSDAGPDKSICSGDTAQIGTSPTTNYTYSWSPTLGLSDSNAANPNVSLTNNTNSPIQQQYVVTTDSANIGCTSTDTMVLTVNPPATAYAGNDTMICPGGTASLQASGGTSYAWSNGSNSASTQVSPSSTTTYIVTVTNQNGCTAKDSVIVSVNTPLSTSITTSSYNGGYNVSCNGASDGSIDLTVNGGTPPYTYSWNGGTYQTEDLQNLDGGNYQVTVTDFYGCSTTASTTLSEPQKLATFMNLSNYPGGYNISCFGNSDGSIDLTVNGGTPPYSYSWNGGQYQTKNINNLTADTYSVTVTDTNGCTIQKDTTLTQPPQIELDASLSAYNGDYNVSCPNASDGSIQLVINGGFSPYSYSWSNGATTKNLNNISAGQYSITVTDSNGCTASIDTTLEEPAPLSTELTPSTYTNGYNVSCADAQDGSIVTDVSGGTSPYNFSWNNGAYTKQDLTGLNSGIYNVSVTDANGCTHHDSITLSAPPPLEGDIQTQQVTCFDGSDGRASVFVNGGTAPYEFFWSNGRTDSLLRTLESGDYTVTVKDANNCQNIQSATVTEPSPLTIDVPQLDTIQFGDTTQIPLNYYANGNNASFQWNNSRSLSCQNCAEPLAYPLKTTEYKVTMTDEDGCITSETMKLVVEEDKTIYIPNAFTPDQNDLNDRFRVYTKGIESGTMKIFNRWGQKIYETDKVLKGWDGTIGGRKPQAGVYIYLVELHYPDDTVEKRKGSVTVIR